MDRLWLKITEDIKDFWYYLNSPTPQEKGRIPRTSGNKKLGHFISRKTTVHEFETPPDAKAHESNYDEETVVSSY